jgi:hypothetical protein
MTSGLLAQTAFGTRFQAALTQTASSTGAEPALGAREEAMVPTSAPVVTAGTAREPFNAGYDTARGFLAVGGVALAIVIIILLFAVAVTSKHRD